MERDYLETIVKECGLYDTNDVNVVIKKIQALDEVYERDNLVEIYSYFL